MQYKFATLFFGLGASAASIPRWCTFGLNATGDQSGPIGQLDDGQNRVGGDLPKGSFSISNGQITDGSGRGCILTPPTAQFQCDEGATPSEGFSIGGDGKVSHEGSSTFFACPADEDAYNLYTKPVDGQDKCVEIGLTASGCYGRNTPKDSSQAPPLPEKTTTSPPPETEKTTVAPPQGTVEITGVEHPSPEIQTTMEITTVYVTDCATKETAPPAETVPPQETLSSAETAPPTETTPPIETTPPAEITPPADTTPPNESAPPQETSAAPAPKPSDGGDTGKTCPPDLGGDYQYPHLIVPVSKTEGEKAYCTSYNGKVTSDVSSIFNFDIPSSYTGTCSLVFLFPEQAQLETSSFTFDGDGVIDFKQLKDVASEKTTYNSQGDVMTDFGSKTIKPGSSTVISTFDCPAGEAVSYELSAVSGTSLDFFQDYNPSPLGLYITTC